MAEPPDRDTMIHLLNRLGSENDADVLEAARHLHGRIAEAGIGWDDLLVASIGDEPETAAPSSDETVVEAATRPATTDDDALALIEKLLAKPDISDDLRAELTGYRTDIAEGEFADSDRQYVQALYERLS